MQGSPGATAQALGLACPRLLAAVTLPVLLTCLLFAGPLAMTLLDATAICGRREGWSYLLAERCSPMLASIPNRPYHEPRTWPYHAQCEAETEGQPAS